MSRAASEALIAVSESERRHIIHQGVPASKSYGVTNGIPAVPPFDRSAIRRELGLAADDVCIGFSMSSSGKRFFFLLLGLLVLGNVFKFARRLCII